MRAYHRWLAVGVLLLFFGRSLNIQPSPTFDEPIHLLHSVAYWNEWRLYPIVQNPPLSHALMGAVVELVDRPNLPASLDLAAQFDWLAVSQQVMWESAEIDGFQLISTGRYMILLLAMVLLSLVMRWTTQLWRNPSAGVAAMALASLDPNLIAHAQLATTDLAVTLFLCLAGYLCWRYWAHPTTSHLIAAGVGVGLALATKFSAIVLLPAIGLMAAYRGYMQRRWRPLLAGIVWGLLACVTVLAVYRFDFAAFSADWDGQFAHLNEGHSGYLLGQRKVGGWWYYFPVIFAAKTPTIVLVLGCLALVRVVWNPHLDPLPQGGREATTIALHKGEHFWPWLIAFGLGGAALLSRVNLGYRYLLPILPLLYVSTGVLWRHQWSRALVVVGCVVGFVMSWQIHPHYLAFFNQIAGGSENGHRIGLDSNIDWGQDVGALAARNSADFISYLGSVPPTAFGLTAQPLPGWPLADEDAPRTTFYPPRPTRGTYAFSLTQLYGVYLDNPDLYQSFRNREPTDKVGHSIWIYDVASDGEPTNVVLSGVELTTLAAADYAATIDSNDIELRWLADSSALIFPNNGQPTWMIIGRDSLPVRSDLLPTEQQIGQSDDGQFAYFMYEVSADYHPSLDLTQSWRATEMPTLALEQWETAEILPSSPNFADTLTLHGYQLQRSDDAQLTLTTVWDTLASPTTELKLFVHLIDEMGEIVAQADGFGAYAPALQAGDLIINQNSLSIPDPTQTYGVQIGLYDPQTGARLPLVDAPVTTDRILLETIP